MERGGTWSPRGRESHRDRSSNSNEKTSTRPPIGLFTENSDELSEKRRARFSNMEGNRSNTYGYVSRGEDSRLQKSAKEREDFFNQILQQFIKYCDSTSVSSLALSLPMLVKDTDVQELSSNGDSGKETADVDSILRSLRKLREALLHLPANAFTKKVYLFSIRVSTMVGHYHTYLPSIMFLLDLELLDRDEIIEISTLLIIHLSHFNNDNTNALAYYFKYTPGVEVLLMLKCWIHKDYYNWIRFYNKESDTSRFRLMQYGLSEMVRTMIQRIGSSFYNYDLQDLEASLPNGLDWQSLVREYDVKWKHEATNIVIRERRR
ncbi:uncharacterized protein CANTADRAFT_54033 [Suhomyces tanzawaensis NRRL Y-17324]|uniref:CSN8/PSMD8/EIF3K domain-containing protein n=1 Tax=Suhomyces tanzawaensis NRRL Y-17324 TaxID=984487 RepID=A0A1E4SE95_9ASCO|nr:uncharacterized protein CANTADRAFT_54033 [Suhomyces tanzawaensis NRRL Y-17324]ODV77808.1 hypothetical protein CANTADRAFT_54033 [Suhomyces tanzawaensis NRRL Y-17324]